MEMKTRDCMCVRAKGREREGREDAKGRRKEETRNRMEKIQKIVV